MKRLRVLLLMHGDLVPPHAIDGWDVKTMAWRTEYDVETLEHEVHPLGVTSDLGVIRAAIEDWQPHIAFNLLEEFDGISLYDQHVVSYLELLHMPYTGCNPHGLMLARDKALAKKVLSFHRIPYPEFAVIPQGRTVKRPKSFAFPLIVKLVSEEASLGISQASIVGDDDKLKERVKFIHQSVGSGALIERYMEGREFYVGVIGNGHLQAFLVWELIMDHLPDDAKRIKWSQKYQKKYGITSREARISLPGRRRKFKTWRNVSTVRWG